MIKITSKRLVSSLIATLAISTATLSAADYGSVNGDKITNEDIAIILRNPSIDFNSLPKASKDKVLEQVVRTKLLTIKAIDSGIYEDRTFKEALEKTKKDLALKVWMQKEYGKVKVTDKEIKDYFNKNKAQFKVPATLQARHIVVKTEKEASAIISELNKAGKKKEKFIALAKSKSTGPSGPKGGDLGKFPENAMVPEFSKAAMALSKGKYSKKPVKTQFGYHVIYLEDKEAAKKLTFKDVKPRIAQGLVQQKFAGHVKKLTESARKNAKIVIK